jgi:hypothetical protein
MGTYLRKSMATIFRVYTLYRPLKTFFAIGSLLMLLGFIIGARFLWFYAQGDRGGHIQSLILAAVFLITGFHTWLIALLADLIAVNRRLTEDVLIRVKKLETPESTQRSRRPEQRPQPQAPPQRAPREPRREVPAAAAPVKKEAETQWVWLLDEEKLNERVSAPAEKKQAAPPPPPPARVVVDDDDDTEVMPAPGGAPRRRRRRRGGAGRQHDALPGNRGKHLVNGTGDDSAE